MDPHVIRYGGRHVLADEVGANRELAMTTVHEDREADRARTPVIDEGVHGRAHGATGEEHVVDEHHDTVVDGERDLGLTHHRRIADTREVVAIQSDIDGAQGKIDALVRANGVADPRRESIAARADADDREKGEIAVALDDLVRDPCYGPTDVVRPKQRGRLALLPGLTGPVLKGDRAPTSIGIPAARGCP
jgi:hypothetical protein